jgi:hypothetical protein
MTIDGIHGKVRKRLYKRAYEQVTGCVFEERDEEGVIEGELIATHDEVQVIDPLKGVSERLKAFDQKREVVAFGETYQAELEAMNLLPAELDAAKNQLFLMVEQRCAEIHNGRGERSNRRSAAAAQ